MRGTALPVLGDRWSRATAEADERRGLASRRALGAALVAAALAVAPAPAQNNPDLALTVTGSPDPVLAGGQLTFSVTVTNNAANPGGGNDNDSTNTTLAVDLTGTPLAYDSETIVGATCSFASPVLTCDFGTVADDGGSKSGDIVFDVASSAADASTINLSWVLDNDENDVPGPEATSTTVDTQAELAVSATTTPTEAVPGQNLVYAIQITNNGPSDAANVAVTLESVTGLPAPTFSGDCAGATCTFTSITAGDSADVTMTIAVPDDFHLTQPSIDPIEQTVTVTSDTPEPTPPGDRTHDFSSPVNPKADVEVTIDDGIAAPDDVASAERIAYTVTVTSSGPSRVDALTLTGSITLLSIVSTPSEGYFSASSANGNWGGLDLASTESVTLTVTGFVPPALTTSPLSSTVTVAPRTGIADADGATDTDADTPLARAADLRITKTNNLDGVVPAQEVPYTIRVTNYGPSDVSGATVADTFDALRVSDVSWSCGPDRRLTGIAQLLDGDGSIDGLDGADAVAVSPDGLHVYVAGAADNALAVFSRDATNGLLTFVQVRRDGVSDGFNLVDGLAGASGVAISPDGLHVYATGASEHALAVFSRDVGTGGLTWIEVHKDATSGVDGLAGARGVAVAPDGRHVYAVGETDDAVAVFSRNPTTGALTWLAVRKDGVSGVIGMDGARGVAVSPDGRVVLVASAIDDALVSFRRNISTGLLTFQEAEVEGGGFLGLDGASAVVFGPRGDTAHVAAADSSAVTTFSVDGATGALGFLDADFDGVGPNDGLAGARGIAITPDARQIYVMGTGEGEIAVLGRVTTAGPTYGTLDFNETAAFVGAFAAAMSPAGEHLYVTSLAGSSVAIFDETAGASCDPSGTGDLSEAVTLPAHTTVVFEATATIAVAASGTLVNTALVTGPGGVTDASTPLPLGICSVALGDTSNNRCTDSDPIGLEADLDVTKTAQEATAVPGEPLTYVLVIGNDGPAGVNDVAVADPDLTAADFFSADWTCTASGGAVCDDLAGSGNIAQNVDLPAGGSVRFDITVVLTAQAAGTTCPLPLTGDCVENSASATLPLGYVDPTPDDLQDSVATPIGRRADLQVAKTVLSTGVGPGDELQYQIEVRNCGPSDVEDAQVVDTFPAGYTVDPGTGWTCTAVNGTCGTPSGFSNISVFVDLEAGDPGTCANAGVATFLVDGDVDILAEGVLTNVAKALEPSGLFDPSQGNNTAAASVVLTANADLAVIKDDGLDNATPGAEVTYQITVVNNGPDNATQVSVADAFPAILRDVRWTCSSEAPAIGTLTFVEEQRDGAALPEGGNFDGLDGARGVAVAPDPDGAGALEGGLHVYATGFDDDALVVFERDVETGELTTLATLRNGDTLGSVTIDGLDGATGVAVSPDGLNVYVAGATGDAVAIFSRNPITGVLSFVDAIQDGDGGTVDGLDGARDLVVSADGDHLYVAGEEEDAVAVFERDAELFGALEFLQVVKDGAGGFDGLDGAARLRLTGDGAHLYVAAPGEDAITTLRRRRASDVPAPPAGDVGKLVFVETLRDGDVQGPATLDLLDGARAVGVSPDDRHVYVGAGLDDAVTVFLRETDPQSVGFGRLTFLSVRYLNDSGAGGPALGLEGVTDVLVAGDGEHLYVASDVSDAVAVFQRTVATGVLKFVEFVADGALEACVSPNPCTIPSLDGATMLAFSPDDVSLYVAGAEDDSLSVFLRAGAPPAFDFIGGAPGVVPPAPVRDGVSGVDGIDGASAVAGSADGKFLYATGFADGAIAAFERVPATGELQFLDRWRDGEGTVDGLEGAIALLVVEDNVYVASQSVVEAENAVAVFSRDPGTGLLTFVEVFREGQGGVTGLFGAAAIAASPDGRHLYVASRFPGAVAVFEREPSGGELTFLEAKKTGIGGVSGIQGAQGVAISSDGVHVYVAASVDDGVGIFERVTDGVDPDFGRLTQVSVAPATAGLDQALGIAVSPPPVGGSSRNVYVTGKTAGGLTVYARNVDSASPDFGQLSPVQTLLDGTDGVDGLAGARAVVVSPDGKNVYVAGEDDDALAVFAREATGGTLMFVEARRDGEEGIDGLDQPYGVAVTPNSRHVYVASLGDDAIAAFARASTSRCTGSGVGNLIDIVDVAAYGQVVYTVVGRIDPAATGFLVNEARVTAPPEIEDPDNHDDDHPAGTCPGNTEPGYPALEDNDACRDIDALAPRADLALDKTDRDDVAIPGESLTYTITISNDGPSNVVGAQVHDDLTGIFIDPDGDAGPLPGVTWTCVAAPSGSLTFLAGYREGDELPGPVTLAGLDGASAVAVSSPDGAHLYAAGLGSDAVVVFAIDGATGELEYLETEADGVGGVDGLDGATAIAVSPDGEHVYVASKLDDAIVRFRRDSDPVSPTFGQLTFGAVVQFSGNPTPIPGADLVLGIDQPVGLAIEPDGESLYVAAANSNAVTVFARNTDDLDLINFGRLTFVESEQDGVAGVDGLAGASAVAVDPDPDGPGLLEGGNHVYVTGANDDSVAVFSRDDGTGELTFVEKKSDGVNAVDGLETPRAIAISSDGASVYVAGAGESAVAVFVRDDANGTLTFEQVVRGGVDDVVGLAGVDALAVAADGFHVYGGGGAGGSVAVFRRDAEDDGRLAFVEAQREGFGAVEGLEGTSSVALNPAGDLLFATGRVDDAVVVFRRPIDSSCASGSDGVDSPGDPIELSDIANIAAGSKIVYTLTGVVDPDICPSYPCTSIELENTATVTLPGTTTDPNGDNNEDTDVDSLSPRVDLSITKTDHVAVIQGLLGASAVAVSPDGEHVYATGFLGDGVVAFARDAFSGDLAFVGARLDGIDGVDGLNGASAVYVSPEGAHVYVAGASDNAVVVFERDPATGILTFVEKIQSGVSGVTSMLGPSALAGSDDGSFVYVGAASSSAIAIFARDGDTESATYGRLTFLGAVSDGADEVDGLGLVRALALARQNDGTQPHLYAVGESDNAVAAFARDTGTGLLTFVGVAVDGVGGVSGLSGAHGVASSPDGHQVYVVGRTGNSIAVFQRDFASGSPNFGKLTFSAALVDGSGGIDGLAGARAVAVAPDPQGADPGGQHVYVAGSADDGVAIFTRDAGTGALSFVAVRRNGTAGISGLGGASGVALAPNGDHLYATGADDAAVVALDRDWDSGALSGTGDLSFVGLEQEGGGTVAPGTLIEYEIVVTNHGPSAVRGAVVTDVFPGALEDVDWVCTGLTSGSVCLGGLTGEGDLSKSVNLPPGGGVRIVASGTIKPGVTGTIVNTATVTEPLGVIELDPSDNSATDGDTVLGREADLEITKVACTDALDCDGTLTTTAVPGAQVLYRVRVENLGPSDVEGARVVDVLPEALVDGAWTCDPQPVAGLLETIEVERDGDPVNPIDQACEPDVTAADGLAGARGVGLSPDGLNLYVAGSTDDAVAVYRRDLRNGELEFVEVQKDGAPIYDGGCDVVGSVDGLDQAAGVVVSPDGSHVYAVGEADDAIVAFERDFATGRLTFLQLLRDGVGGANGLGNVRGLAISPDGSHVYTAASSDNGVGIFARNPGSGLLTFLALRVDGQVQGPLTLDGLAGASAVSMSPDGDHLYVAGETDGGVAVFERDPVTGLLTFVEAEKDGLGGVDDLAGASGLAVSEDGRSVYASARIDAAVVVFRRNVATGALEHEQTLVDGAGGVEGLAGAAAVTVSPDGEHVYAAGASADAVAIFARDSVTGQLAFLAAAVDGVGGLDGMDGAAALAPSPDGEQIYVAGAAEDAVAALARKAGSRCAAFGFGDVIDTVDVIAGGSVTYFVEGTLAPSAVGTLTNVASVEAPDDTADPDLDNNEATLVLDITPTVDLVVTKDDGQTTAIPGTPVTYTITLTNPGPSDLVGATVEDLLPPILSDAIWSCVATGAMAGLDLELQGVAGVDGLLEPRTIAVAPDPDGLPGPQTGGAHVYVASLGSNAVALFARDPGTGELSYVTMYADGVGGVEGLGGAAGVAVSPEGKHVYAVGSTDGALVAFTRDVATGLLTPADLELESDPAVDGLAGAAAVTLSPDGRHVYVASPTDDAVAVFARDKASGALTFVERQKDGFGDLELLVIDGAAALAVTPDGQQLLVLGSESDSLAVFDRDGDTGRLTFRAVFHDGEGGVAALDLPQAVVVSPSGRFVYVAALADDAIAMFDRDAPTGEISYAAEFRDGVGGLDGLDGVRGLALSRDGLFLYAVGYNEDALVQFRRNAFTGALEPLAIVRDGVGGVEGLDGVRGVAVAPHGPGIYTIGDQEDALAAFARTGLSSCTPAGTGDILDTVDIAVGGSVTYTLTAFIAPSATGQLVNTVEVDVPLPSINIGDPSATDIDDLTPVAALTIVKDDFVTEAIPGATTLYLITVTNAGPSDAPDSLVEDALPPEVSGASWTCEAFGGASCTGSGSGAISELVDLPVGSSVGFAFLVSIDPAATGTLVNTATVTPAAGVTDPNLADNSSTDTDTLVPHADLGIDKTVDPAAVNPGAPITFTLTVTNYGPSFAAAEVVDLLPAGLTNVAASGTGWSCGVDPGVVTCTATLAVGVAAPIEITADAPVTPGVYVNVGNVATTAVDGVPANDTDTAQFAVGAPPTVVEIGTVPAAPDLVLSEMETALYVVTGLTVEFSEPVADPPGDGGADDVTNPANYLLLEAGADGNFSTTACGAVAGDDLPYAVGPVTYSAGTNTATVAVGTGTPLTDGLYRLLVCGSTSIVDLDGVPLDGDGDGVGGDDFVRHFRIRFFNLLVTPFFDFATDLDGWTVVEPAAGDVTVDPAVDSDAFPLSGTVAFTNVTGGTELRIRQCLPALVSTSYIVYGDVRTDLPVGSDVQVRGVLEKWTGLACTGTLAEERQAFAVGDTGGLFSSQIGYLANLTVNPGPVFAITYVVSTPSGSPLDVWMDNLGLFQVLFADGFEGGDTQAWDDTVGLP